MPRHSSITMVRKFSESSCRYAATDFGMRSETKELDQMGFAMTEKTLTDRIDSGAEFAFYDQICFTPSARYWALITQFQSGVLFALLPTT